MFYKVIILYFKCILKRKQRRNAPLNLPYSLCDNPRLCMGVCEDAYVCMCLCDFGSAVTYREHLWGYPGSQHNTVSTSPFDFLSPHLKNKTKLKPKPLFVYIDLLCVCVCICCTLTILCGIETPDALQYF